MANNSKSKLKTLYIQRILEEETDADHGLTMAQLIARLNDYEIPAERKGVYRDIQTLRDFGVDIQTFRRNPVEYAIVRRDFSLSELMLLVDAVESCKALTKRQSNALVTNLKLLASDHERELLDRRIHVQGRISSKNDSVFGNVDVIHEALREGNKVEFMYFKFGADGERHATRDGLPRVVTPVGVTYDDGFYYLTAWDDEHAGFREFRIDRMEKLKVSNEKATRNEEITHYTFDGDEYESFGRFGGEPTTAMLLVDGDKVEIIMDRFGEAATIRANKGDTAIAMVKIRKSPQFFGWVAGMNGAVKIASPTSLKNEYIDYLKSLIQ